MFSPEALYIFFFANVSPHLFVRHCPYCHHHTQTQSHTQMHTHFILQYLKYFVTAPHIWNNCSNHITLLLSRCQWYHEICQTSPSNKGLEHSTFVLLLEDSSSSSCLIHSYSPFCCQLKCPGLKKPCLDLPSKLNSVKVPRYRLSYQCIAVLQYIHSPIYVSAWVSV